MTLTKEVLMFHTADEVAAHIKPLIGLAKTAYGSQPPGSPSRVASEKLNAFLLVYADNGGSLPELATVLDGEISLSGLRRRLRIVRAQEQASTEGTTQVVGRIPKKRGSKDPELVQTAAKEIGEAREQGGRAYGDAVRKWYEAGVSMTPVSAILGVSTYSLWSARRTAW